MLFRSRATYFICSKRNNYTGLCSCKQISANVINDVINEKLKTEFEKVKLSDNEIKDIYNEAENSAKSTNNLLHIKLKELNIDLENIENNIEEIYQDKINKLIQIEDFKSIYEKNKKREIKYYKKLRK